MLNLVAHKRPEGHFITNQPRTKEQKQYEKLDMENKKKDLMFV